jgi:hypothetical protein
VNAIKQNFGLPLKISYIALFCLLITFIYLLSQNSIPFYEYSIYDLISSTQWISLILIIGGGSIIVGISSLNERKNIFDWKIAMFILILINGIILLLPYLQGYMFAASGDYILCRKILNKTVAIIAMLISTIPICFYYTQIFPMGFAILLIPFILSLYFESIKSRKVAHGILLIIMIGILPMTHPVTAFIFVFFLLILELNNLFLRKFFNIRPDAHFPSGSNSFSPFLLLPLIAFLSFLMWVWHSSNIWTFIVNDLTKMLSLQALSQAPFQEATFGIQKLGLNLLEIGRVGFLFYGLSFFFFLLSMYAIINIFRGKETGINNRWMILGYVPLFLLATLFWIIDFFYPVTELASERMKFFLFALFPCLVGLGLYSLNNTLFHFKPFPSSKLKRKTKLEYTLSKLFGLLFIPCIFTTCFFIAFLSLYPSPITLGVNDAITTANNDAMYWYFSHGNYRYEVLYHRIDPPRRYVNTFFGTASDVPNIDSEDLSDFPHFNYNNNTNFGELFKQDHYIILREGVIDFLYSGIYSNIGRFSKNDLYHLNNDITVNKIYLNGEVTMYSMKGTSKI